jgi:hypothetical protein
VPQLTPTACAVPQNLLAADETVIEYNSIDRDAKFLLQRLILRLQIHQRHLRRSRDIACAAHVGTPFNHVVRTLHLGGGTDLAGGNAEDLSAFVHRPHHHAAGTYKGIGADLNVRRDEGVPADDRSAADDRPRKAFLGARACRVEYIRGDDARTNPGVVFNDGVFRQARLGLQTDVPADRAMVLDDDVDAYRRAVADGRALPDNRVMRDVAMRTDRHARIDDAVRPDNRSVADDGGEFAGRRPFRWVPDDTAILDDNTFAQPHIGMHNRRRRNSHL